MSKSDIRNLCDRGIRNLSGAIFDTDLVSTRITLALAEVLWAVMLFWPGDTFGRPTYALISGVMSEMAWAFTFLISGLLQLSVVLFNQYGRPWAQVFANWNAVLWVFVVGASLLSVYPPPAAMGGEVALAGAAVWIWVRQLIIRDAFSRGCLGGYILLHDRRKRRASWQLTKR